jgi:solute carrier family 30 (zinc transporter), member 1
VENVHELHIWQLSDVKMIASVHIGVNLPKLNRIKRYHQIARAIRTCLHAYGIHSSTIQPEFSDRAPLSTKSPQAEANMDDDEEEIPLLDDTGRSCMFECGADCIDNRCCDGTKMNMGGASAADRKSPTTQSHGSYGSVNGGGMAGAN